MSEFIKKLLTEADESIEQNQTMQPEQEEGQPKKWGKSIKTADPEDKFNVLLVNVGKTQTKSAMTKGMGKVSFDQNTLEFMDLKDKKTYKYQLKANLGGPMKELFIAFSDMVRAIMEKKRTPADKVVFKNVTDSCYYTDNKMQRGTLAPTSSTEAWVVGSWGNAKITIGDMIDLNTFAKQKY